MLRATFRITALALAGAIAAAAILLAVSARHPVIAIEMDRDLPSITTGLYHVERAGDETFAWTAAQAGIALNGLDRNLPWACTVRIRTPRPPGVPRATIMLAVDGAVAMSAPGPIRYEDLPLEIPARPDADGLLLTIATTPTFRPATGDTRQLGSQIDRVECRPRGAGVRPARAALVAASVSGMVVATAAATLLPLWGALASMLTVAIAQAVAMTVPPGAFDHTYLRRIVWMATAVAVSAALLGRLRRRGRELTFEARGAIALSAVTLLVELVAVLHPAKLVIDAVFHAHRLEWVMGGRYLFTQPMPDGVSFPYAIGLYVAALPWAFLASDHVALLKVVVCVARAVAGLSMYPLVADTSGDRRAAVVAVGVMHAVPASFDVIGYANLTYAFAQSLAAITLAAAGFWSFDLRTWRRNSLFVAVCAATFLSHVGVFPVLLATLGCTALLRWWLRPDLRRSAWMLLFLTAAAAVLSIAVYYGHFEESYRSLARVRAGTHAEAAQPAAAVAPRGDASTRRTPPAYTRPVRVARAATMSGQAFGWPVVVLMIAGAAALVRRHPDSALATLAGGAAMAWLVFVGWAALSGVEPRFQRYTEEFIVRVDAAMSPIAAVLAALGATALWRTGLPGRAASVLLLAVTSAVGVASWLTWLR